MKQMAEKGKYMIVLTCDRCEMQWETTVNSAAEVEEQGLYECDHCGHWTPMEVMPGVCATLESIQSYERVLSEQAERAGRLTDITIYGGDVAVEGRR